MTCTHCSKKVTEEKLHEPGRRRFKICPLCEFRWESRDGFLNDPDLKLIGYQVDFVELKEGLFLFNHSCNGTLAIEAGEFRDLYDGPIFTLRATGTEQCDEHCLHQSDLRPCPAECECAYVREVMQLIRSWAKVRGDTGIPQRNR